MRDIDATTMAAISAAITAYLQAEDDAAADAMVTRQDSAWAKAGRASQLSRRTQMQWRPSSGLPWRSWAI